MNKLIPVTAALLLTACGGGSDGSTSSFKKDCTDVNLEITSDQTLDYTDIDLFIKSNGNKITAKLNSSFCDISFEGSNNILDLLGTTFDRLEINGNDNTIYVHDDLPMPIDKGIGNTINRIDRTPK